jgi:predicted lipid carrier protein YhbT
VLAYNLELAGGRFHSDVWFGLAWGGFPVLNGYAAVAGDVRAVTVLAAAFAVLLSLAQRALSSHVRYVRRRVIAVRGELELADASREPLDAERFTSPAETGLRLLSLATVVLAATLVAFRI